jgi:hypothetical protein
MADTPAKPCVPDTSPNTLVQKLVDDKGIQKPYVVLVGYFGAAPGKAGYVRLYTSLEFCSYYEIQTKDFLHTERPDLRDAHAPATAYVTTTAKIDFVQRDIPGGGVQAGQKGEIVQSGEADYLQGAITSCHLAGAKAVAQGLTYFGVSNPPPCPTVSGGHPHCAKLFAPPVLGVTNPPPCPPVSVGHHPCIQSIIPLCPSLLITTCPTLICPVW